MPDPSAPVRGPRPERRIPQPAQRAAAGTAGDRAGEACHEPPEPRVVRGRPPPAPALRPAGPRQPGRRELRGVRDPDPRPGRRRRLHRALDDPRPRDPEGDGSAVHARPVVRLLELRLLCVHRRRHRPPRPERFVDERVAHRVDLRPAPGDELPHELRPHREKDSRLPGAPAAGCGVQRRTGVPGPRWSGLPEQPHGRAGRGLARHERPGHLQASSRPTRWPSSATTGLRRSSRSSIPRTG